MKKIITMMLACTLALTTVGCGKDEDNSTAETKDTSAVTETIEADNSETSENSADDSTTSTAATTEADSTTNSNISYDEDESHSAKIGEKLSNEFFDMTVNSAHRMTSVNGYTPNDETFEFLCVNVKVRNNNFETVNVGTYDFTIRWGDGEDDFDYAIEQEGFGFDNYPAEIDLPAMKFVEGNVFFMVPADAETLSFEYIVLYDNNTEGDTYYVELTDLDYMDDPEPAPENAEVYFEVGAVQSTDYFDMVVTDAFSVDEIGDFYLDEGWTFLGVNTTITNTSAEAIEAGAYYFCAYWGEGGEDEFSYAVEEAEIVDMPISTELAAGESISGIMYFIVPADTALTFEYTDFYSETEWKDYRVDLGVPAKG